MQSYNLGFIADADLFDHVKQTVEKYRFKIDLARFNKNLIPKHEHCTDCKNLISRFGFNLYAFWL